MNRKGNVTIWLIALVVVMVLLGVTIPMFAEWAVVQGNEALVIQHWQSGVQKEPKLAGTHFFIPGIWYDLYKYNIGTQKITFDNQSSNGDSEYPPIAVQIGENGGQEAYISVSVNYHINAEKIVTLHKQGIAKTYEAVVLKREIVDIVNEIARPHKSALDIFSGIGFVQFKNDIEAALKNNPVLKDRGIEVENTIVYGVHLDQKYETEIRAKINAIQEKLRFDQETLAKQAEAAKIFAESQAQVERVRQTAEASKITQVKAAEAQAEQQVLAADAEKRKRIALAEGERDANLALASGILAVGEAEAKVSALKRESLYAGESGERRARVEIATAQADKMRGMLSGVSVVSDRTIFEIGHDTKTITSVEGGQFDGEKK